MEPSFMRNVANKIVAKNPTITNNLLQIGKMMVHKSLDLENQHKNRGLLSVRETKWKGQFSADNYFNGRKLGVAPSGSDQDGSISLGLNFLLERFGTMTTISWDIVYTSLTRSLLSLSSSFFTVSCPKEFQ